LGGTQGVICVVADMQTNGTDLFIFQTWNISAEEIALIASQRRPFGAVFT
jgi:hypothetical protein